MFHVVYPSYCTFNRARLFRTDIWLRILCYTIWNKYFEDYYLRYYDIQKILCKVYVALVYEFCSYFYVVTSLINRWIIEWSLFHSFQSFISHWGFILTFLKLVKYNRICITDNNNFLEILYLLNYSSTGFEAFKITRPNKIITECKKLFWCTIIFHWNKKVFSFFIKGEIMRNAEEVFPTLTPVTSNEE